MIDTQQKSLRSSKFNPRIVVCIPAYNEENNIGPIILKSSLYADYVLVCDDGSNDYTGEIAKALGATVITHETNCGYGAALKSLFNEALRLKAEIIVTIDGDNQHNPEDIPKLVNEINNKKSDIVIGSRFLEGGGTNASLWRIRGIKMVNNLLTNNIDVSDSQSGFRAYNKKTLELLKLTEDGMGISTEILIKAKKLGLKIDEIPLYINYYDNSSTHNPFYHGINVFMTTIKHLSINNPLFFYGLPGILSLIISSIFWLWTIQAYAKTSSIITNVAIMAVGTTMIGLTLMSTALILWVLLSVIRELK